MSTVFGVQLCLLAAPVETELRLDSKELETCVIVTGLGAAFPVQKRL